jgi:hypothetical protein
MPRIQKLQDAWQVDIIESERGWGSKVDETIYFDNESEARAYVTEYNDKYNPPLKPGEGVPDWYMIAQYVGKVG